MIPHPPSELFRKFIRFGGGRLPLESILCNFVCIFCLCVQSFDNVIHGIGGLKILPLHIVFIGDFEKLVKIISELLLHLKIHIIDIIYFERTIRNIATTY